MTGTLLINTIDTTGNLDIGQNASVINIGNGKTGDSKIINIGYANDTVNILGTLNSIQTTNTQISNKVLTLNEGSTGNNTSNSVGI